MAAPKSQVSSVLSPSASRSVIARSGGVPMSNEKIEYRYGISARSSLRPLSIKITSADVAQAMEHRMQYSIMLFSTWGTYRDSENLPESLAYIACVNASSQRAKADSTGVRSISTGANRYFISVHSVIYACVCEPKRNVLIKAHKELKRIQSVEIMHSINKDFSTNDRR
ncbi:hypothetical protein PUN28_008722 [Cardiocondyla obscurior]|uniref:Uncharacterized protein n=1 Tax=Cardiocondyla obscurior TaxID=286306 RepID=A0AAW2G528_9HYME